MSLSTNNQRDGGMQAYIAVAGGAASGAGSATLSRIRCDAFPASLRRRFYCVSGTTLSVTDPASGLLAGTAGANGCGADPERWSAGLTVQSNGTFNLCSAG